VTAARRGGRRLDRRDGRIELSHGSGGRATTQLVDEVFGPAFANPALDRRDDSALIGLPPGRIAVTTDGHVVRPRFFPGGDLGSLAVYGTVNDLAAAGARPLYLTASFVLEEGLAIAELIRLVESMALAASRAEVSIVAGDTKVVERGHGDGVFISTTGVGVIAPGVTPPSGGRARPGDAVLVSGPIGDHGIAVMAAREGLEFVPAIVSDSAPLHGLVAAMQRAAPDLHALRDATRGGVAAVLHEIAVQSQVGVILDEAAVPVRPGVAAACDLLGLDPLHVACEGRLVAMVDDRDCEPVLTAMRHHPLGNHAVRIGTVVDQPEQVTMRTPYGGQRLVDWPSGDLLPRIC